MARQLSPEYYDGLADLSVGLYSQPATACPRQLDYGLMPTEIGVHGVVRLVQEAWRIMALNSNRFASLATGSCKALIGALS